MAGCCGSWEVREKGARRPAQGVSPGRAATARCSPGCKSQDMHVGGGQGKKGVGVLVEGSTPSLYVASTTLTPNPAKDTSGRESDRPTSLTNINAKEPNTAPANEHRGQLRVTKCGLLQNARSAQYSYKPSQRDSAKHLLPSNHLSGRNVSAHAACHGEC